MNSVIAGINTVTTVVSLLGVAAAVICVVRKRLPDWPTLITLAVLELALLAGFVATIVAIAQTDAEVSVVSLVGYYLGMLAAVPAGVAWAFFDRTRYGVIVIAVVCLVLPVMLVRTRQIWEAAGAG